MDGKDGTKRPLASLSPASKQPQRLGQKRKLNEKPIAPAAPSPFEMALDLFRQNGLNVPNDCKELASALPFRQPDEQMIAAYKIETVSAARTGNLDKLKQLHEEGTTVFCCNRFGESTLHLACRRGYLDMVRFLLFEVKATLFLRDDYGRTPLHDACWTPRPQLEIFKLLLEQAPELLFIKDVRGHTPLNYARKEDWKTWNDFLTENKSLLYGKHSGRITKAA